MEKKVRRIELPARCISVEKKPRRVERRIQTGFSLLEILVAFSILAISLGVLLRIFGGGGRIAGLADEYSRAIVVGESVLASLGTEILLQPGMSDGNSDNFHWTLQVNPYPLDEAATGPFNLPYKPYRVDLRVEWGEMDERRALELSTLRLLVESGMGRPGGPGGQGGPGGMIRPGGR